MVACETKQPKMWDITCASAVGLFITTLAVVLMSLLELMANWDSYFILILPSYVVNLITIKRPAYSTNCRVRYYARDHVALKYDVN